LRRLQLAADKIQRVLPVDGQHVIGKPRYIHDQAFLTVFSFKTPGGQLRSIPPQEWTVIRDLVARRQFS
jgi:hypothetical protein